MQLNPILFRTEDNKSHIIKLKIYCLDLEQDGSNFNINFMLKNKNVVISNKNTNLKFFELSFSASMKPEQNFDENYILSYI